MFVMQPYEQMKDDFATKLREVVLRRHDVTTVDKLPQPRRQQVQFLEAVIEQLTGYNPEIPDGPEVLKAKVLTGIMLVSCDEISKDYKYTDPTNSTLFTVLKEVMNLTEDNPMDHLTNRRLMEVAEKFLVHNIYIEGKLGKELRPDHAFAKIEGFDLGDFYSRLQRIKYDAGLAYWQGSVERLASQNEKIAGERTSFLGIPTTWFWKTASTGETVQSSDAAAQKGNASESSKATNGTTTLPPFALGKP